VTPRPDRAPISPTINFTTNRVTNIIAGASN
jgi:hypothetical protein